MKTPPLLLAATLLFWGWQADFLVWAGAMAILVESARLIPFRLNFSDTDLNRIWDLCGLLFVGAYVIIRSAQDMGPPAFVFPQWLPFVFFPMILAQAFGTMESISMKTFSWLLRWRKSESRWSNRRINFSYIYFAICLFGASTTNKFSATLTEKTFNWFYVGIAVLIAWAMFAIRPRRVPLPLWICIMAVVCGSGFVMQETLHQAQSKIETSLGTWIIRMLGRRHLDPNEGRTAIGRIGRLKLSGRIVLRVEPADKQSVPDLLREATYVSYKNESWYSYRASFSQLASSGAGDSWSLVAKQSDHGATIHRYLDNNGGVLAIPLGASEITNLPAVVNLNPYGTIRASEAPGFLSYFVRFGPGAGPDSPPGELDTRDIPDVEREALLRVAHELELDSPNKTDKQKLHNIAAFFANYFKYSMYITEGHVDRSGAKTPLSLFLEKTRSGHCEYFATATVLLARIANIPARYATGYSVQESGKSGDMYIVRERHAHAWALIWNKANSCWENFDTTPASWDKIESERASLFESISDAWSRLVFEFSKWRYGKTSYQKYLIWALIPLILVLVWRIVFNKERKQRSKRTTTETKVEWPGLDSEFYQVEKRLTELGLARRPDEPLLHWKNRLSGSTPLFNKQLEEILVLHKRYRFDPAGVSAGERTNLATTVREWMTLAAKADNQPSKTV